MNLSKWRGAYVSPMYLKKIKKKKLKKKIARNCSIFTKLIGHSFYVHTGNSFKQITITKQMVGHKIGEFVPTRAIYIFKKKKSKK